MRLIQEQTRKCRFCGEPFTVRGYQTKTDRKKFCSQICKHRGLRVHPVAKQMSAEDAAWFAGVFDGEGWISWPNRSVLTTYRIGIASTSLPLLERVQELTGTGRLVERSRTNQKHSRFWVWYSYSLNAGIILRQCVSRLIVKRDAVEVALGIRHATEAPITERGRRQSEKAASSDLRS